jgi:hypothetical protein
MTQVRKPRRILILPNWAFQILFFIAIIGGLLSTQALGQSGSPIDRFSAHDPDSKVVIDHSVLTEYLRATILPVGRSFRILGNEKPESYRGSRIRTAKALDPSRFEGSRIFIHAFADEHKEFFKAYQVGLENLSNRRPLADLNRSEQAAFWLNLYNVIVINKLVDEYPIQKLKNLREGRRGNSFWTQKVTTIEGVALSLRDIETILFTNFNKPEIVFGLWQGSIGGPRILNYAYTGKNVWRALEGNALEFVNSNRGLRPPTGTRMNVSDFYGWMQVAFGPTDDAVLGFIKEYADPNFVQGVSGVTSINYKIYDWTIADILGGSKHSGQHNQLGGVLVGKSRNVGADMPSASANGESFTGQIGGIAEIIRFVQDKQPLAIPGLPEQALQVILGITQNTRMPRAVIYSEECAPGDDCVIESVEGDGF